MMHSFRKERSGPVRTRAGPPIVGSLPTVASRAGFRSKIAVGSSSGPAWLKELWVRITRKGREKMSKHSIVCAGIDTGKHKLDVALEGRAQVRAYAMFHLQRAKNDKIDAGLIATCTAAAKKIHAPPDPRLAPFAQHLTFIEQITEDIAQLRTRRESCRDERVRRHWDEEIRRFKAVLRVELKQVVADIRQYDDLAERLDLILSVDGVGLPTAVAILIRMPEIGRVTREQAAALVGF